MVNPVIDQSTEAVDTAIKSIEDQPVLAMIPQHDDSFP
jgi:hypothetical protein